MKYFAKLKELDFVIPVVIVAIVAVFAYNTFVAPWLSDRTGKDLSA